ncbi:autotransporter-associated beta strand repeat-containing protein, partial [Puniceicoccaceae bacterium]|nr:autotransporter-associated beta strand repeat-containing protein [Puniceicoccaceae bacterium]
MKTTPKTSNLCHSKLTARAFAALALISLTFSSTAQAATKTWNGSNTNNPYWYANSNWTPGVAPVDGDDLVFTGTVLLNHLAYANWGGDNDAQINSITFDAAAGAFVIGDLGGGPFTYKMIGDITNNSTSLQTINFPFQLNADVTANAAAGDIIIGGVIGEDGSARSLIKSGSNTLSLTGASTYTGATDINAGKLQLGNGGTTGSLSTSSAIDMASDAAFMVNRTDTVSQGTDFSSAAITGDGYIVSAGDGTLVLDRANSHTGGARIGIDNTTSESATRVLQVTDSDALGTGTLGFFKSGTLELGADALTITNNVFSGNYSAPGNDKIIKLDLAGTATGTLSGDIDTRGGIFEGFQMDVGVADTLTLSGTISTGAANAGQSGITKIGDGTLIMSGTNTYDGTTRVNAGTLKLSGGSAIEDIRDVFVDASGTLDLNGSNETINRLTGTGTIDNTASNGILTVGHNSATFQFDGTLTDTVGSLRLTKVGAGTLTLTGANTHTFTQIGVDNAVPAGTMSIENNAALGTGNLSYEAGGTLQLGVNGLSVANGIFVGNRADTAARTIQLDLDGSNTGELTGNIDIRVDQVGEFVADVGTDDTLTFSGNLVTGAGGNAGLTKAGAGTLVLEGTNTYKGPTTVSNGTLSLLTDITAS